MHPFASGKLFRCCSKSVLLPDTGCLKYLCLAYLSRAIVGLLSPEKVKPLCNFNASKSLDRQIPELSFVRTSIILGRSSKMSQKRI